MDFNPQAIADIQVPVIPNQVKPEISNLYADLQAKESTPDFSTMMPKDYAPKNDYYFGQSVAGIEKPSLEERNYNVGEAYTTLNDGTLYAKFDSFKAGINNEEYQAQQQSTTDKWLNGLGKTITKTGVVVLGNTVGFVNGFVQAAKEGSISAFYDNSFTKTLDDWNTKLDYNLPNYYSQQEKDAGFFGNLGSANFWANDVLAGTAFTLGTVVSEAAWAYATGGSSLALRGARIGAELGTAARVTEETFGALNKFKSFIKQPLKAAVLNREGAILGSKIGEAINTLRFGLTSASGEAAAEAWHYKKEAKENFYNNFEKLNGRKPDQEDIANFENDLANTSNTVFATNYFLVGGANLAFLGGSFGVKNPLKSVAKSFDRTLFGIGTEATESGIAAIKASRFQNVAGKVYGVGRNLASEVLFEEGLQNVTNKVANNWIQSTYNPKYTAENLDLMGMVYNAMSKTYGTSEGWEELGTAALITVIGGGLTGNLTGGAGEIDKRRKEVEQSVAGLNTFSGNLLVKRLAMTNQIQGAQEREDKATANNDLVGGEIARNDKMFSRLNFNRNIKRDSAEDIEDLRMSLDTMTPEQFKEAGIELDNIDEFKSRTLEEYTTLSNSYEKNRDFAEAITGQGEFVGAKQSGFTDKQAIVEAITYNLTMGEVTGNLQTDLLGSIKQEVLGNFSDTMFTNALDIDNVLKNASGATSKEYYSTNRKIKAAQNKKKALERELLSLERYKQGREENVDYNQRYAAISQRIVDLGNESSELLQQRNVLLNTAKIENPFIKNDMLVGEEDLNNTEENLGRLNKLIDNLKTTNPQAHLKIGKLIKEYNRSVEQFKAFDDTARALSSPNYKPQDQSSILSKIINSGKSMDEYTQDFFTRITQQYAIDKASALAPEARNINEDISNNDFQAFTDTGVVPAEIVDRIAAKVKNGETLLDREKQIYNSNVEQVNNAAENIIDRIEVNPPPVQTLSAVEELRNRIEKALKTDIALTYVGDTYDDKQPTQQELDTYETLYNKIKKSKRPDKDFATRVNPRFYTLSKSELGLSREELEEFQRLNLKLSQWRMLDGSVEENESVADLIELLSQLQTTIDNAAVKNTISKQENIDIIETEDIKASNDATQNSFTQVHDTITAKIEGDSVRFSDLNIQTIITRLGFPNTIVDPKGKAGNATPELIQKFAKTNGTQFIIGASTFTIGEKGRISIPLAQFENIKTVLNLTPLSTNFNHSTYSPVYEQAGESMVLTASDFTPRSINVNSNISYNPDANYTLRTGDNIRFEIRLDQDYNANLVDRLRKAKTITPELAKEVEDNMMILTVTPDTQKSGAIKASHSTTGNTVADDKFLKIRKLAYTQLIEHIASNNQSVSIVVNATAPVGKVILGVPNMQIQQTESGYEPIAVDFNDDNLRTVVNTGYILNGKPYLAKEGTDTRFDFTTKLSRQNPGKKIPVIVFEYKGNNVAYPISLITTVSPKSQELIEILDQNITDVEKVKAVNNLLIKYGIEPSRYGLTKLDTAKLQEIRNELDLIEDFMDVEDLRDQNYDKENLKTQAQIALNLTDRPLTAPKLVLDLQNANIGEVQQQQEFISQETVREVSSEITAYNKEIVKLRKQQDTVSKKIDELQRVYSAQVAALNKNRSKQGAYSRIATTRDLKLAALDEQFAILDDKIIDLENNIADIEESVLYVPAEDMENIETQIEDQCQ